MMDANSEGSRMGVKERKKTQQRRDLGEAFREKQAFFRWRQGRRARGTKGSDTAR